MVVIVSREVDAECGGDHESRHLQVSMALQCRENEIKARVDIPKEVRVVVTSALLYAVVRFEQWVLKQNFEARSLSQPEPTVVYEVMVAFFAIEKVIGHVRLEAAAKRDVDSNLHSSIDARNN